MAELGYTLSSEEHEPNDLVDYAARAEAAGFGFASISDHYHPWVPEQGESAFVWSTLGGVAHATDDLEVGTGVTCPTVRMHPAVVAQAAATTANMLDDRFYFGVGSGEALNEHIVGEHWPDADRRLEMLEEAVEVIRKLWSGEQVTHHGEHYTVETARLFTLPEEPPPIVVSAFGSKSASLAADVGDGFWCTGPDEETYDSYREAGGDDPSFTQLTVCHAEDEADAIDTVYEEWPNGAIEGELAQELPSPAHFEQAAQMVEREDIAESNIAFGPEPDEHIRSVQEAVDAGYDHVYVHQIGDDQMECLDFYESEVLPSFT
jgi:G6PDH family F420-dependent oxidoreductase